MDFRDIPFSILHGELALPLYFCFSAQYCSVVVFMFCFVWVNDSVKFIIAMLFSAAVLDSVLF